ncbi:hypothetical protein M8A51_18395 [Schlegelella sp. S2-27]|uniref:OmpA-like domain-containing protein n=1 Tax=Caldimonas mangrovi TaxID=2944811 RepID=A0ABT0YRZ9_9BURK|nr:hypothetical protein [Caldimonas mangrovi]MCM5681501.1 hypothetical protein [Caldimonas mangrovi]
MKGRLWRAPSLALTALCLAGCAGTARQRALDAPPTPIEVRPVAAPPAGRQATPAPERRWSADLRAVARKMQQAALEQGAATVDRTSDDRVFMRMPIAAAFAQRSLHATRSTVAFLDVLADALDREPGVCVTLAENPPFHLRQRPGPKPYPRAQALRSHLMDRGVDPGRLAIEVLGYHEVSIGAFWPAQDKVAPHVELMLYSCPV